MNYNYIPALEFSNVALAESAKTPRHKVLLSADFHGSFAIIETSGSYADDKKSLETFFHKESITPIRYNREYLKTNGFALLIVNKANNVHWLSQGVTKLTGYEPNEAMNRSAKLIFNNTADVETEKKLRMAFQKEEGYKVVLTNRRKNGEEYWCSAQYVPLYQCFTQEVLYYAVFLKKTAEGI
jgi:PAS domain S-box-containing protein